MAAQNSLSTLKCYCCFGERCKRRVAWRRTGPFWDDNDLADGLVFGKARCDFTWFDAIASDFELVVETTQKFEKSVGSPADPVAGPVKAGTWFPREPVGKELLARSLRLTNVTKS